MWASAKYHRFSVWFLNSAGIKKNNTVCTTVLTRQRSYFQINPPVLKRNTTVYMNKTLRRVYTPEKFKVCHRRPSSSSVVVIVVHHLYLLSSHVSTLVHCISTFYSTYISFYLTFICIYSTCFLLTKVLFTVFFTDRVFTVHNYINTVQVLLND